MTSVFTVFTNISEVDLEDAKMASKKDTSYIQLVRELSQRSH